MEKIESMRITARAINHRAYNNASSYAYREAIREVFDSLDSTDESRFSVSLDTAQIHAFDPYDNED